MEKGNFQKISQTEAALPPDSTPNETSLVLLGEDYSGRDEINLAGLPFALLQSEGRGKKLKKATDSIIRIEWPHTTENGTVVTASWEVNGHTELGLPGPSDELIFLVLMQLTREAADEQGTWPQTVHFSAYDLISRCGWGDGGKFYKLLADSLSRFASVKIRAKHSFFDARAKKLAADMNFSILAASSLFPEKRGPKADGYIPLSWFRWSDEIYASFLSGHVRNLALDFLIALENPTARRLFRLLDKFRYSRKPALHEFAIGVLKLRDRLGMTAYPYASKVKEKLSPAISELIANGYLQSVDYAKNRDGIEIATFTFGNVLPFKAPVEQGSAAPSPAKATVAKTKRPAATQLSLTDSIAEKSSLPDVRLDAIRCHAVFIALDEGERNELLELAKQEVSPIWHDRLGLPESPMSLGLWQLVAQRYPEKLK